jgi:hypothetical protein
MKFSAAVAFIFAATASASPFGPAKTTNNANSAYVSKLVRGARETPNSQLRRLEDNIDLTNYSVKFEQCQFVKTYSDDLADEEESSTVLQTQRFVIFRLCPNNSCESCQYNYGEYVIDLETYLEATVEYQQELQENMCQACQEYYENQQNAEEEDAAEEEEEDGGRRRRRRAMNIDYETCYDECQKIENMEENGYVDAVNFLECQMVYDPEDDGQSALYAGPICSSNGSKIKIGVFSDEECNIVDANKDVEDYLKDGDGYQMKLSHALLKTIYAEDTCISCLEPAEEDENAENADADDNQEEQQKETTEMCQNLYEVAAKCEDQHGMEAAAYWKNMQQQNGEENDMYNQEAQEELVCDYIQSLKSGTYDESGEIVVSGGTSVVGGGAQTTGGQKFALTFFILGTVGLAVYAAMLHSKLTKGGKADLANQGGAMA